MRVSRLWVLPGLACAALMLSCESGSESVAGVEGLSPQFAKVKPCQPWPECKNVEPPPPPPPPSSPTLTLSGAITATGDVEVQADNSSTLELGNGHFDTTFAFALTALSTACVTSGVFGGDKLLPTELLDRLKTSSRPRNLDKLIIDKTADISTRHHLEHEWREDKPSDPPGGANGSIVMWIGDPSFDRKAPVPAGANSPKVTTADLGAGTMEYTFESGHGVVLIKQLFGRPKDHPKIVCPLLDDVTATVSPP